MTKLPSKQELEFIWAMTDGKISSLQVLFDAYEELRSDLDSGGRPRLAEAVTAPNIEVLKYLLTLGYNVNAVGVPPYGGVTALQIAIGRNCLERTELLLRAGACPNVGRPVLASMLTRFSPERQIEFLQLMIAHQADLNRLYSLHGDTNKSFSALDFAPNEKVRAFLANAGALAGDVLRARGYKSSNH